MAKDTFEIIMETKEVEGMLKRLLSRVENPRRLIETLKKWVHSQTMLMFRGRRPDNSIVRGVKWPKLKPETVKHKKALVKRGKAIVADRPMVRTGRMRDSLKVLSSDGKGFVYGTNTKSKKGFPYPGHWNTKKFPWLFLTKKDYAQLTKATIDYLNGHLKSFKTYIR